MKTTIDHDTLTDSIRDLALAVADVRDVVDSLAAALDIPRHDLDDVSERLFRCGQVVREQISAACSVLQVDRRVWSRRDELEVVANELVRALADRGAARANWLAIAAELRAGIVVGRQAARTRKLEGLRVAALAEIEASFKEGSCDCVPVPWPAESSVSWVMWVLALVEPEAGQAHAMLSDKPALLDLLTSLTPSEWQAGAPFMSSPMDSHAADGPSAEIPMIVQPSIEVIGSDASAATDLIGVAQDPAAAVINPTALEGSNPVGAAFVGTEPLEAEVVTTQTKATVAVSVSAAQRIVSPDEVSPAFPHAVVPESATAPTVAPAPIRTPTSLEPGVAPISLTDELATFECFLQNYWRDPAGNVERVPWLRDGFAERLADHAEKAFATRRWAHLILFARAAESLSLDGPPYSRDVESLLALLGRPDSSAAGVDPERRARLRDGQSVMTRGLRTRMAIFLEAIRPSDGSLEISVAERAIDAAGFVEEGLPRMASAAFAAAREGHDILELLRRWTAQGPIPDDGDLAKRADSAREELRQLRRQLWSAAGGVIKTTHCRDAWQEFMDTAHETFDLLATSAPARLPLLAEVDNLRKRYESIADDREVKYGDRSRMDRAANKLLDAAREVVLTTRRLNTNQRRSAPVSGVIAELEQAFRSLPARSARDHAPFLELLDDIVSTSDPQHLANRALTFQDFAIWPALAATVPLVSGGAPADVAVTVVIDPVRAAAILVAPFSTQDVPSGLASTTLAQRFRDLDRTDMLIHLHPMSDRDARDAATALTRMQLECKRARDDVAVVLRRLDAAAHPLAAQLRTVIDTSERLLRSSPHDVRPDMVAAWLKRVTRVGENGVAQTVAALRVRLADVEPDRAAAADMALSEDRIADAIAYLNGQPPPPTDALRLTLWRPDAETRYPNPERSLLNAGQQSASLRRAWSRGLRRDHGDDELRIEFTNIVFESVIRRDKDALRHRNKRESAVKCKVIRDWLTRAGLNPSFLPQITQFSEIVVVTPPCLPTDEAFVRLTVAAIQSTQPRIAVILAPKLSRTVRETFRDEIRARNLVGVAIIDDLDLVRMLSPGSQQPELILALLELVLEQQPRWTNVTPFEAREGQHTKIEMYVGRQEEASELATKATYSRLFSGRRLGKSALLKHVTDTYAHATTKRRLASKHALSVVYVGIVGEVDERKVVQRIEEELAKQLKDYEVHPTSTAPAERLTELVGPFLGDTNKSLLVFLDEADMFVEAQIRTYEHQRENALSWRMRTNLESTRDSMDHPRVRFVFSGYRATQRREGAWANWGDVLRLRPLSAEEGARLIAGPLARLGIDVAREASNIAFRCGYQPAVVLRFGQLLLEHLDETILRSARGRAIVTAAHVTHVFQNPGLQQEIRTVVWNNFQGNSFGRIVFAALLLELARLPPGGAVADAPRRVWERLQVLAPDFLDVGSAKGSPLDRVSRELRGFVERSLLLDASPDRSAGTYMLLFPHHLPVLLQEDQELVIRQEVQAFGSQSVDEVETVRSLLADTALETLAYALGTESQQFGVRAAVAVSHWPTALSQGAADVATRLGIEVAAPAAGRLTVPVAGSEPKVHYGVTASWAARMVATPEPTISVMIGGLDLLRWSLVHRKVVEMVSVTRLGLAQMRWWFGLVRGLTFDGVSPVSRFFDLTGGIPILVDALDRELERVVGFDGSTASIGAVDAAIDGFHAQFATRLEPLRDGQDDVRLEQRERELLVMYARANREFCADWADAMTIWDEFGGDLAHLRPLAPGDESAFEVLLRSGLIPSDPRAGGTRAIERIGRLANTDPLHKIADLMQSWLLS